MSTPGESPRDTHSPAASRVGRRAAVVVAAALGTTTLVAAPAQAYTVRPGDTISHIAERTGTSVPAIVAANGLDSQDSVRAGQVLTLPGSEPDADDVADDDAPDGSTYRVRAGDTVSHIAARTGSSAAAIIAANGLDARATIRTGQQLRLPAGGAAAAPAGPGSPTAQTYTVRAGDTVSHIAARAGTSVGEVLRRNDLSSSDVIHPGQVLELPGPAAEAAPMSNTFAGRTYPEATVQAATANRDALYARDVPSRDQMQGIIADAARAWGVDPALAQAIAFQESGFSMRAVSPANAVGAMQVIPSSGRWASQLAGRELDLLDPQDNATAGVVILRQLHRMEDNPETAIAGYYQGLGSVRRNGMYADTRQYVANVQTLAGRFR